MAKLLKVDLKRIFKDKLLLVVAIIGVVLALTTPLIYKFIYLFIGADDTGLLGSLLSIKTMFYSSFSLSNNIGFIIPVFLLIIMSKDFSYGTIRNKIISGSSRTNVFLSMFISCSIVIVLAMLAYAALNGLLTVALFSNEMAPITKEGVLYFVLSILFEILIYIFIAALLSFINVFAKNAGLKIILYVALAFGLIMIYSIVQVSMSVLIINGTENQLLMDLLEALLKLNVFYSNAGIIGAVDKYIAEDIIYILVSTILGTGLFVFLGIVLMNKKDIK